MNTFTYKEADIRPHERESLDRLMASVTFRYVRESLGLRLVDLQTWIFGSDRDWAPGSSGRTAVFEITKSGQGLVDGAYHRGLPVGLMVAAEQREGRSFDARGSLPTEHLYLHPFALSDEKHLLTRDPVGHPGLRVRVYARSGTIREDHRGRTIVGPRWSLEELGWPAQPMAARGYSGEWYAEHEARKVPLESVAVGAWVAVRVASGDVVTARVEERSTWGPSSETPLTWLTRPPFDDDERGGLPLDWPAIVLNPADM